MFIDLFGITQALPWAIFTFILVGYTWTTLVDNTDVPSASHINTLQTEKLDRDGEIAMTGTLMLDKGADIPSAGTLQPGADGNYFDVTGTTTITAIQAAQSQPGTIINLHFDGILTLTHHVTNLILPGGANITTAAGDEAEFVEYDTDKWQCTKYTKAAVVPGVDGDAIHDNVSGEINAIAEKGSPVSADLLLIEDSEAGNVKKKAQVGNLPLPLNVKIGTFTRDVSLATGTQVISGVGFQPKEVEFKMVKDTSNTASFGYDDGTNHYCTYWGNIGGADQWGGDVTISIYYRPDNNGNQYKGLIQSMGADGFTISWTKLSLPTGTITVIYRALG